MAYDAILDAEIQVKKPVTKSLWQKVKDNFEYFLGTLGGFASNDIPNGDMEVDSAATGFPDNWDDTTYASGDAGLETTAPLNGSQSMKFVHPGGVGNGGGYADSDYMPTGDSRPFVLGFLHKATASGMKNQAIIRWFDKDKVTLGADTTVYESTNNPASITYYMCLCKPPSAAKFFRVRLVGGNSDTNVAGTALFDGVSIKPFIFGERDQPATPATISENSTNSTSYVDIGSAAFNLPFRGCPIVFTAALGVKVSAGAGNARLRHGSDYSSAVSSTSTSYGSETNNPAVLTTTSSTGYTDTTIYLQAYNVTGGANLTYAKMDAPAAKHRLEPDNMVAY